MLSKFVQSCLANRLFFFETILTWVICALVVLLYASLGRPIWIDEFLHFAFAAFGSTSEAWNAIKQSTVSVNHGQTGIYMLVNHWLLKLFGAEILALRAPSLISAFLLCYFAALFVKMRGYGFAWQIFSIFIMCCQAELMYFSGEARPYMPLAAAAVGVLLYYLASSTQRELTAVKMLGWFSVLFGVLMHPYFSIYWLALVCFGLWVSWLNNEITLKPRSVMKYLNIPLCVVGAVIYFALASQTWLVGSPIFDRDPFHFMPRSELPHLLIWHHTTFLGPFQGGEIFMLSCLVVLMILIFLPKKIKHYFKLILPPIVLIFTALGLTLALSYLSYHQNYWILTRQWVASIALVAVGFVWLCAAVVSILLKALPIAMRQNGHFAALVLIVFGCWQLNEENLRARWRESVTAVTMPAASINIDPPKQVQCPISPDTWVELANKNLKANTSVWPIFKFYYSSGNTYCGD
jgi:hypothetical protein